jgi:DNA polymerase
MLDLATRRWAMTHCHTGSWNRNGRPLRYTNKREATMTDEIPPSIKSLTQLRAAEAECTRCPLYRNATQVVPGEGPAHAAFLFVGEQPGNKEDLAGRPFVGPAGRVLDQALADADIPREETFVTNAVKHFKHEMRGKRRLHKRPNAYEVERCKWWLDLERLIVKPVVVVALGATAARSLLGRPVTISRVRGTAIDLKDGTQLVVTIHPSALLRMDDEADKREAYRALVKDLKIAAKIGLKAAA